MKNILINLLLFHICFVSYCYSDIRGWGYINLHCRDNDNAPVDWWYIYKPPSDVVPFFEFGRNFTFITPESKGRWQQSRKYITSNSMLQHTLAPIYRPTYTDYLAVAVYDERKGNKRVSGSLSRGVLMADEMGGVWLHHTVPGLVDLNSDRPTFPESESSYGHLIMCLSIDLDTINSIAYNLRNVYPKLTYLKIPKIIQNLVPNWRSLEVPLKSNVIKSQELIPRDNSIRVELLTRPPGDKDSIYKAFANSKNIILDVFGQRGSLCKKNYGVRSIQSISLKYPEKVYYLNNKTDKMHFAVSTAAHWQVLGSGPRQYWTCISNLFMDDRHDLGGDLVCVEDYKIWLTFDNLKVKEPEC